MPKNKKPSKNGFWQFVMECRDKNPNKSMEEAKNAAATKWANMTKEQKKPYEDMAQLARGVYRPVKLTSDGFEVEEVERQQQEAERKIRDMQTDIQRNFKSASTAGNLDEEVILLIHINHLTLVPAEEKYYICEIAVASFTLKNGIEDIFHAIVKPGKLPLGFYGPAMAHSKETHQMIDLVQVEPYDDNTREVFYELIKFMRVYGSHNHKLPVLYADEKTFAMTKRVFETFQQEFEFSEEIRIYNMQYMFFCLKNAAAGRNVWPTETFSYNAIEKDLYCYCPNIGCDYHETSDIATYCSKSIVTRYAYTICDNCCSELNIQLRPGFHVPSKARITSDFSKVTSKTSSMCSLDQISNARQISRGGSVSSVGYNENYPPLGSSRSSSSITSFSSMKSTKGYNNALTRHNVAAMERSFEGVTIGEQPGSKRDHKNMKFPKHE